MPDRYSRNPQNSQGETRLRGQLCAQALSLPSMCALPMRRIASALALPLLVLPLAAGTASQSGYRPAAQPVELTRNGHYVDVRIGGRPFTTYYFDPVVAKPYFFPL